MADIREAYKGTILEAINNILEEGVFILPPSANAMKEGAIVIGEATDFEKAIFLAHKAAVDENNAIAKKAEEKGTDVESWQIRLRNEICDALSNLFWASVSLRLGEKIKDMVNIGIFADWKIVGMAKDDSSSGEPDLPEILKGILGGGGLSAVVTMGIGHNCENCPQDKYDACKLSAKKPR